MSNGLFGKGLSQENTWIPYYTAPSTIAVAKATVSICNPTGVDVLFDFSITSNVTPSPEDYLEYQTKLIPDQVYERSCIYLSPGEKIFIRTNVSGVPIRVSGVEVSGS